MTTAARGQAWVRVDIGGQRLLLLDADGTLAGEFPVSTAAAGAGERCDSGCTPRGKHRIRARIGMGAAPHTVFVGRRPTGETWTPELAAAQPGRDWILGRILWLCGCEPGRNRFGDVDSMRRYIYIHGTPPTEPLGVPRSHGCIRMCCADVVRLCDLVPVGTRVEIL